MELTFWGVRGAIPAPGPETNRYGGNTPCVTVSSQKGHLIIIDAGTGIVPLGRKLIKDPSWRGKGYATLLLSHTHWDHIQGFPFFPPIFVPGNRFDIYGPTFLPHRLEGLIEGQMNPNFSPLYSIKNLGATIRFLEVDECECFTAGGVAVTVKAIPHGHTSSTAFRLEENGKIIVYASDVGYPSMGIPDDLVAFYRGADLLIHDCTYTPEEQAERRWRGYSSVDDAVSAALKAEVKRLALFHYDQDYGDDQVDALADRARRRLAEKSGGRIDLIAAAEGQTVTV